jgi:hypothetical protein
MARTTIEIDETTKETLQEMRLPHESNYNETIERLCGEHDVPFTTESDVKTIVSDMVVLEALE